MVCRRLLFNFTRTSWLVIWTLVLSLFLPALGWSWQGRVVRVFDGDTVEVLRGGHLVRVRLYGIDAPEKDQPYGLRATLILAEMVMGRQVQVRTMDRDRYGRTVGVIRVGAKVINQGMLVRGAAWYYGRYCRASFCRQWWAAAQGAQRQRQGLWQAERPVPPWQWRHQPPTLWARLFGLLRRLFHWLRIWLFNVLG